MKRLWITVLLVACILPISIFKAPNPPPITKEGPTPQPSPLESAILEAARGELQATYAVPLFDFQVENLNISADGSYASAWLVPVHPETGEIIPMEPGLALATWNGERWQVTLPTDPGWHSLLAALPYETIPDGEQQTWLGYESTPLAPQAVRAVIGGYLLPWAAGKTVYLSRSTAHDASFPTGNAHYSFDFYISKTMYDLHAAKTGTVWLFKDTVPNNDHSDVNYLVLQDNSVSPPVYQLYLHLAQNSIPASLKSIGAPVAQGQFIGIADNTGASTGHHLHFQVQEAPYWNGYWGKSVDITFDDVAINGGRPRVAIDASYCDWPGDVCNTFQSAYVSGNVVQLPPSLPRGDMTAPQNGITLTSNNLTLSGWAADDTGISSARFKAYFEGEWQNISPSFTSSPFSYNWDVCSGQVPDGPVSVALEIRDLDGNLASGLPGLRHLVKQVDCGTPQPVCVPGSEQAALFAGTDFSGKCVLLGLGEHQGSAGLGDLGVNNAASIWIGGNAVATLYRDDDLSGRSESFIGNDVNLADNRIGADATSSVHIQSRSLPPAAPRPMFPVNGAGGFTADDTIGLYWEDGGGGTEFKVKIDGSEKSWQTGIGYHAGPLAVGNHTWQVKARNSAGESAWSSIFSLQVLAAPTLGSTRTAPFSDNMENGKNGWSNSNNWDQSDAQNHTANGSISWSYEPAAGDGNYDTGTASSGDLTSSPISIPGTGYYLRFWYYYETETQGSQWDRRWVQISANGSPFQDVLQLQDDPPNIWLQSPALDLSPYSGQTIRVRFHFETLDAEQNAYKGWFIDDFSVNSQAPPLCSGGGEPNNTPAQATLIAKNSSASGTICAGGDVDFYKVTASAGDQVGISTVAQSAGSVLDTTLFLLAEDGASVLAENDDIITGVRTDSLAMYRLKRSGTYFIKLRAWNHPSVGGEDYSYTLNLLSDASRPQASITAPPGGTFLPNGNATIVVDAADSSPVIPNLPAGISHVDFFWHPGDWALADWIFLGTDWDSGGGWTQDFDTSLYDDQKDIGFYIQAYDWAGNTAGAAIWKMALDRTPPQSTIKSTSSSTDSTAVRIEWTASDNIAGIDRFELQSSKDGGSWQTLLSNIGGEERGVWVVLERDHSYGFRLRAIDRIGNIEEYPASAETSITISQDICDTLDIYENDNSPATATSASGLVSSQVHNFCNPAVGANYLNDQDWTRISVKAGRRIMVIAEPLSQDAATVLRLYAADGSTLLDEAIPGEFGETSQIFWDAPADGSVYVRSSHLDGAAAGDDIKVQLSIRQGFFSYLPFIGK